MVAYIDFNKQTRLDTAPPQNVEAEEAILGGCLLDSTAYNRINRLITADCFWIKDHQEIWKAINTLGSRGEPTDLMTVTSYLADKNKLERIGGTGKLAQLVDRTVSAVNIDRYAILLREKFLRRELITIGHNLIASSTDTYYDLSRAIEYIKQNLEQAEAYLLTNEGEDPEEIHYNSLMAKVMEIETEVYNPGLKHMKLAKLAKQHGYTKKELDIMFSKHLTATEFQPLMTFNELMEKYSADAQKWLVNGFLPQGSFNLIHAIGGVGKTLLAYDFLCHILSGEDWNGLPVTNAEQRRAVVIQCDESPQAMVENLRERLEGKDYEIKFKTAWSIDQVLQLRRELEEFKPDLLIIDSLTAINKNALSENDAEYAKQLYLLRHLVNELNLCAIVIHHSNKKGDSRGTTAIPAAFDQMFHLSRPSDSTGSDDPRRKLGLDKSRFRCPCSYDLEYEPENKHWRLLGKTQKDPGQKLDFDGTCRDNSLALLAANRGILFTTAQIAAQTGDSERTVRRVCTSLSYDGMISKQRTSSDRRKVFYYVSDCRLESGIAEVKDQIQKPVNCHTPPEEIPATIVATNSEWPLNDRISNPDTEGDTDRYRPVATIFSEKTEENSEKIPASGHYLPQTQTEQEKNSGHNSGHSKTGDKKIAATGHNSDRNCHTPPAEKSTQKSTAIESVRKPNEMLAKDSGGHWLRSGVKVYYSGQDTRMKHLKGMLLTVRRVESETEIAVTMKGWGVELVRPSCEFSRAAKGDT